jgi:hypothetical protein
LIERAVAWFWVRVGTSAAVPDGSLRTFRRAIGVYLLVLEAPHYAWIDRAPRAFFDPPTFSLSYVVGGFPSAPFFVVLDLVAIAAIVLMTIGVRTRAATIVVVVCRLIGSSFLYSFGKIDHTIILTALLALMAYCNWGEGSNELARDSAAVPSIERRSLRALGLMAVVVSFGFVTAALPKLVHWVDGDTTTSGVLSWYYEGLFNYRRDKMLAGWFPGLPTVLLEVADVSAVALELIAFLALVSGRISWRLFLLFMSLLHLTNVLVLNIEFTAQAITYLAFVDLSFRRRPTPPWARWVGGVALAAVVAWHVQARLRERGSPIVLVPAYEDQITAGLYIGAFVGGAVVLLLGSEILRERRLQTIGVDYRSTALDDGALGPR